MFIETGVVSIERPPPGVFRCRQNDSLGAYFLACPFKEGKEGKAWLFRVLREKTPHSLKELRQMPKSCSRIPKRGRIQLRTRAFCHSGSGVNRLSIRTNERPGPQISRTNRPIVLETA